MNNLAAINEVIKASPAIQIQSNISHLQRRAWNVLLANAYNELPHTDTHHVNVVDFAAKLGFNSKNEDYLKETLEALVDCTVKWNLLGKDKKQEWGVASLLASAQIKDGICSYEFPKLLRLKLHNPRVYAKLNLRLQSRFKSRYALILWEVCFDYFDRDREKGQTPFIPLETFRELMGIEADEYRTFKALNQTLIKPAVKEINEITNYLVEAESKRLGRKVAELKFHITKVNEIPVRESLFPDIENLSPVAVELVQAEIDRNMAMKIADQAWDFVTPEKLPEPGTYPDFLTYIAEKIEISLPCRRSQKSCVGISLKPSAKTIRTPKCKRRAQLRAEKAREKALEDLTAEFRVKRDNIIRQAIHAEPELVETRRRNTSTPTSSENDSLNTHRRWRRIRKAAWSPRRSTVSLRRSSVRSCLHRLLRHIRMRRTGYWNSGQQSAVSSQRSVISGRSASGIGVPSYKLRGWRSGVVAVACTKSEMLARLGRCGIM